MIDTSMDLRDGRSLAYTEVGATGGPILIYFHGAPGSRLDLTLLDDTFASLGARVVSPDRPGYGCSSPQAGRRLQDWPGDVVALADHVGADRFAVIGVSWGAPYAVACAAGMPDRVTGAGLVCGATDFGWSGAWDGLSEDDRTLMRIDDEREAAAWCEARYGENGRGLIAGLREPPVADGAALADAALSTAIDRSSREALRQGVHGYAQDIVVGSRPWTFDPRALRVPVWIVHGEADTEIPVAHARHTAEQVADARLMTSPDDGHISILMKLPQVAAELAATLR